jgi:hypothetical protein
MGMKNYSNVGHVVKASDLTQLLTESVRKDYLEAVEYNDCETVEEILGEHMPDGFAPFTSVFNYRFDDIETEDLEDEDMYVTFDAEDLYVKVPSRALELMKASGLNPTQAQWVTYS